MGDKEKNKKNTLVSRQKDKVTFPMQYATHPMFGFIMPSIKKEEPGKKKVKVKPFTCIIQILKEKLLM